MLQKSDWSQFIPEIVAGVISSLVVAAAIAYLTSKRFKEWLGRALDGVRDALKWIVDQRLLIMLHLVGGICGAAVYLLLPKWGLLVLSVVGYTTALLAWRLATGRPLPFGDHNPGDTKRETIPTALHPGIANSHLGDLYIDPPAGHLCVEEVCFQIEEKGWLFDTNEQIRYSRSLGEGGTAVDLQLREPQSHVRSLHFLINSANSKEVYRNRVVGEIRLVFSGAPPIVVELVLGENIREWCIGNDGDFVREASSPRLTTAWTGSAKNGKSAVIDCLGIPVHECMSNCLLEKVVFVHRRLRRPSVDTIGVHLLVSAVALVVGR